MQILYFTMFMTTLILYAVLGLSPEETKFRIDREVFGAHMSSWHKAAVRTCAGEEPGTSVCPSGTVDPVAKMLPTMKNAPAFDDDRFTSRFDAGTGILATIVSAAAEDETGLTHDLMMAGLNEQVDGESSMIGIFDRSTSRVAFTALTGIYKTTYIVLPPSISGSVPDGSPVIVSRI